MNLRKDHLSLFAKHDDLYILKPDSSNGRVLSSRQASSWVFLAADHLEGMIISVNINVRNPSYGVHF